MHVEEEEAAAGEELYLGTSCSSQYTFTAADTGRSLMSLIESADCKRKILSTSIKTAFSLHFSSILNQV